MVMVPQFTMADTAAMMTSNDYKERFLGEYIQTKLRYEKLRKMLNKLEAGTLEFEPKCSGDVLNSTR